MCSGSRPNAPSLGQGTSDANTDSITKDYIDNGIAEVEAFLAERSESLALV